MTTKRSHNCTDCDFIGHLPLVLAERGMKGDPDSRIVYTLVNNLLRYRV